VFHQLNQQWFQRPTKTMVVLAKHFISLGFDVFFPTILLIDSVDKYTVQPTTNQSNYQPVSLQQH
jgi:hypothetical protein